MADNLENADLNAPQASSSSSPPEPPPSLNDSPDFQPVVADEQPQQADQLDDGDNDLGIEFGDVEEKGPDCRLRPDRNKHYVVAAIESPSDNDLPIFVDLDVMRDMEAHAQADTSVELGGVLLGGQYEDEDGRAFVVITDSLRAEHFEATKGSFKFTHDTWSQITREREEFPQDLQMVGWYHTHPDWGVFLSGMDMFICDNFFNKPLDVALVIDPCRRDRGMFQWTGDTRQRVRRTDGFFVMASRFRRHELDFFVAQLQGDFSMVNDPRMGAYPPAYSAPVVNVSGERNPSWQMVAVMGMLTMQFLLVTLIAWKILFSATAAETDTKTVTNKELNTKIDDLVKRKREEERINAKLDVLDQVVRGLNGSAEQVVDRMTKAELRAREVEDHLDTLKVAKTEYLNRIKKNQSDIKQFQADNKDLNAKLKQRDNDLEKKDELLAKKDDELIALKSKYEPESLTEKEKKSVKSWYDRYLKDRWWALVILGILGMAAAFFGISVIYNKRREQLDEEFEEQLEDELRQQRMPPPDIQPPPHHIDDTPEETPPPTNNP